MTRGAIAARWLRELEKMLEGDCLPRTALRTAQGAQWIRESPELGSREWIAAQRRRAERMAKRM